MQDFWGLWLVLQCVMYVKVTMYESFINKSESTNMDDNFSYLF